MAPSFTAAQQTAGQAAYAQNCASCHGANLDDGEFAPPLKGVEFRRHWFGKPADALFAEIETMPPTAPGSLGAQKHAELLAYVMSQNQLAASDKPVPSDPNQLKAMLLPGFAGGPSGGLSGGVSLPSSPVRVNPLDTYTPVTEAMLQNPPAGDWLTWRRALRRPGLQPADSRSRKQQRRRSAARVELVAAERPQRRRRRSFTTA